MDARPFGVGAMVQPTARKLLDATRSLTVYETSTGKPHAAPSPRRRQRRFTPA